MKELFYLTCLCAALGCGQQKPTKLKRGTEDSKHKRALTYFFYNIGIDTLVVELPIDAESVFYGKEIDSTSALLFPEDMRQRHFSKTEELFGIFKFVIDDNRLGLIARTHTSHAMSIKLLLFDVEKDTVTNEIEVGHYRGYAGDYMERKSWLFRDSSSRHLQALIREHRFRDNSYDNPSDTTTATAHRYTLLNISNPHIDTLFAGEEKLPAQYERLLKEKQKK